MGWGRRRGNGNRGGQHNEVRQNPNKGKKNKNGGNQQFGNSSQPQVHASEHNSSVIPKQGNSQERKQTDEKMKCGNCQMDYNETSRLPRKLFCVHSLCTSCINYMLNTKKVIRCPDCQFEFQIKCLDELRANISLLQELRQGTDEKSAFDNLSPRESSSERQIVTVGASKSSPQKTNSSRKIHHEETYFGRLLECVMCLEEYNISNRSPMLLGCSHTVCSLCLKRMIDSKRNCSTCDKPIKYRLIEDYSINYVLYDELKNSLQKLPDKEPGKIKLSGDHAGSIDADMKEQQSVYPADELMDIEEYQDREYTERKHERDHHDRSHHNQERDTKHKGFIPTESSPHGSKCLDAGVLLKFHCATCLTWVCNDCSKIDHRGQKCYLVPKGDAIKRMTDAEVKSARATCETLENTFTDLHGYEKQLEAFSLTMQAAFEYIEKEKERVCSMMQEGQDKKKNIEAALAKLEKGINLPVALNGLQDLEKDSSNGQLWAKTTKFLDQRRVVRTTKETLLCSVEMMQMAKENKAPVLLLASQKVSEKILLSRLTVEGGRIFVHSLEKMDNIPRGSRAIPLSSIQACLDTSKALTFLEIGLKERTLCRLLIRLMGDTQRGRQFLMMCTGEAGPSYRGTRFHRIWSKGGPGENIWGGDYNKGDGSGGSQVLKVPQQPTSESFPIRAGLVAGSYEKDNPSTIFRIYTKDDVVPKKEYASRSSYSYDPPYAKEVVVKDDSAFGMVEYGLDFLDEAIRRSNVTDIVIHSCGVVIET